VRFLVRILVCYSTFIYNTNTISESESINIFNISYGELPGQNVHVHMWH